MDKDSTAAAVKALSDVYTENELARAQDVIDSMAEALRATGYSYGHARECDAISQVLTDTINAI